MRVVIRAFNKEHFHKDIVIMSERQIHQSYNGIEEPRDSMLTGLLGVGARIRPENFPTMTHFEVVIEYE